MFYRPPCIHVLHVLGVPNYAVNSYRASPATGFDYSSSLHVMPARVLGIFRSDRVALKTTIPNETAISVKVSWPLITTLQTKFKRRFMVTDVLST